MIHLCTIATLMFLQNNTSQKIVFIAARTIQFPGVVFKVCIYIIVAIVTSSIYFDVKSTHTYRKYIYQQSVCQIVVKVLLRKLGIVDNISLNWKHFKSNCDHNVLLSFAHKSTEEGIKEYLMNVMRLVKNDR